MSKCWKLLLIDLFLIKICLYCHLFRVAKIDSSFMTEMVSIIFLKKTSINIFLIIFQNCALTSFVAKMPSKLLPLQTWHHAIASIREILTLNVQVKTQFSLPIIEEIYSSEVNLSPSPFVKQSILVCKRMHQ